MRFLFVKDNLAWPRSSGHDVHAFHMMQALQRLGHDVGLVTRTEPLPAAIAGLNLCTQQLWETGDDASPVLAGWQERFRNYWGVENRAIRSVAEIASDWNADAVVAVGLEVLPLLAAVKVAKRIWYAADEWVWHHLSIVRATDRSTWAHVRTAAIKGLYEFAFRNVVDRAWVVSEADRRAMRWFAWIRNVDVVPNGVDTDHYSPVECDEISQSCTFWGRLDFEPNIQALEWFCSKVWPLVREQAPQARFQLFGFQPTPFVERLAAASGITLEANLPDIRPRIAESQAVVLPFQSGGGIKNKLLEAAAMARPIVCSPRAVNGLSIHGVSPLVIARTPRDWASALLGLWRSRDERREFGQRSRQWVMQDHSWLSAAEKALTPLLGRSQAERLPSRAGAPAVDAEASGAEVLKV
jgi:polysaccharide biosynthesis protein PslH